MSAEQREQELKDEKLQLKRDAEGKELPKVKESYQDKVARKVQYHTAKLEYWLTESRKINQT